MWSPSIMKINKPLTMTPDHAVTARRESVMVMSIMRLTAATGQ